MIIRNFGSHPSECFYCKKQFKLRDDRTVDHVWPKRYGGVLKNNSVYACQGCNNDKADLTLWEWKIKIDTWINEQKDNKTPNIFKLEYMKTIQSTLSHIFDENLALLNKHMNISVKSPRLPVKRKRWDL